jgi:hypothetical protein
MLPGLIALSHAHHAVADHGVHAVRPRLRRVEPSLQTWAVNRCPRDRKAAANGLFLSTIDLGYIIGAVVLGQVAAVTSCAGMF